MKKKSYVWKGLKGNHKMALIAILSCVFLLSIVTGCGSTKSSSTGDAVHSSNQAKFSTAAKAEISNGITQNYSASTTLPQSVSTTSSPSISKSQDQHENAITLSNDTSTTAAAINNSAQQGSSVSEVAGYNRKLMYKANITMEVKDYAKAETEIRNYTQLAGGYILQFSDSKSVNELGGTYILRVPSEGFVSFIDKLAKLTPYPLQRSIQGQDVTEQYVDLQARLKAKQMVEERLVTFMKKATKASDLLEFSNQLGQVESQIEQLKGQIRYLDQNVSFSTISIRLYQKDIPKAVVIEPKVNKPVGERAMTAMNGSMESLSNFFAGLVVFLAGLLPILIVLLFVGGIFWIAYYRHKKNEKSIKTIRVEENQQEMDNTSTDEPKDD